MRGVGSLRSLLVRNRDYRRLFIATAISLIGDWFSFVAVASLVTELTGRPGAAAFIYAAAVLPVFLASPLVGTLADRFDRKRMLVIADLARVPFAAALCLAAWWHSAALAIVAVVALAIGASFSDPVSSAATPNLVEPGELATAQTAMGSLWGSMLIVGAGLGGLVAEIFGRQTAFVINALSFLVSAALVVGIRRPMQRPAEADAAPRRARGALGEAVGYIRSRPIVTRFVLAKASAATASGIIGLLPAFAIRQYASQNLATGLLFAARGLGALVGPALVRRAIGASPGRRALVLVCGISIVTFSAVYAVFSLVHVLALACALVVVAHFGGGAQWTMSTFALQREAPDHVRGRVLAIDYGLATLVIGVSALGGGVLANAYGEATATRCLALIGGVAGVLWLAWSLAAIEA